MAYQVTNGLEKSEQTLLAELKAADPDTRFKMCCNLARSGNWAVVGQLGEPGLFDAVRRAVLGSNTDMDTSGAVDVPMKNFDAKEMM